MNDAAPLPVELQRALVEEVVLRAVAGSPHERAFRRARDPLYELHEGAAREDAFWRLHADWFSRLDLGRPIHIALAELPILRQACRRCVVTGAPTRRDEGADLLVADAVGGRERTVLIRVQPSSFADPDALLALLRAELLHVADMVDPAFGYQPALPDTDGGPTAARLLQDRYRALWNATVVGRLERRGAADRDRIARARREFSRAFPMLGGDAQASFERFRCADRPTHAALVAFALAPRDDSGAETLVRGGRCPLCRFPTHAPEPEPERLPADVVAHVTAHFPAWSPAHGLCRQCADLYRARSLSVAAAETLPGIRAVAAAQQG
jgi:hypothetical protein